MKEGKREGKGETRQVGLLNLLVSSKNQVGKKERGKNTGARIPTVDVGQRLDHSL
jgi:hypothetical protein